MSGFGNEISIVTVLSRVDLENLPEIDRNELRPTKEGFVWDLPRIEFPCTRIGTKHIICTFPEGVPGWVYLDLAEWTNRNAVAVVCSPKGEKLTPYLTVEKENNGGYSDLVQARFLAGRQLVVISAFSVNSKISLNWIIFLLTLTSHPPYYWVEEKLLYSGEEGEYPPDKRFEVPLAVAIEKHIFPWQGADFPFYVNESNPA